MTTPTVYSLLREFIQRRPGLEFADYGNVSAYRVEQRGIARDLTEARELLNYCEAHNIAPDFSAFSGRLSLIECDGKQRLDYCTGQYWPTEYRKAVAAVCASAIWAFWRDGDFGKGWLHSSGKPMTGDDLRRTAVQHFGRAIASRCFN